MQQIVILMGPPGVGKGSVAQKIDGSHGWKHLSTGALLRAEIQRETPLGNSIAKLMASGKLVDDNLVVSAVRQYLNANNAELFILDGFPRNKKQLEAFMQMLNESETTKTFVEVIQFDAPDDILLKRMSNRLVCSNSSCQKTYSSDESSLLAAQVPNICDVCSSELVKRSDDSLATIRERLKLYREEENSLIDAVKYHQIPLHIINGVENPKIVFERFTDLLTKKNK